jgi:hypothetical protein
MYAISKDRSRSAAQNDVELADHGVYFGYRSLTATISILDALPCSRQNGERGRGEVGVKKGSGRNVPAETSIHFKCDVEGRP